MQQNGNPMQNSKQGCFRYRTELNLIFFNEVYYKPQILTLTANKSQTNTTHAYLQQLNYRLPQKSKHFLPVYKALFLHRMMDFRCGWIWAVLRICLWWEFHFMDMCIYWALTIPTTNPALPSTGMPKLRQECLTTR